MENNNLENYCRKCLTSGSDLSIRLQRFLETAGSVLNYFESFLGRIEIMGSSKTIERVYFEINESNIEQWEKPQIKV